MKAVIPTLLVVLAVTAVDAQTPSQKLCNINSPSPDTTLQDVDGRPFRLSQLRGKLILANFWATWCEPCKTEIPDLIDLYRRFRSRGVEIVGVNVAESAEKTRPYVHQMRVNYPVLLTLERHEEVTRAFGVDVGLPTTVVISRDGTICRRLVGLTRKDTLERLLKLLL